MDKDMKKIQDFAEKLGYVMINYGASDKKVNQVFTKTFTFVFEKK